MLVETEKIFSEGYYEITTNEAYKYVKGFGAEMTSISSNN